jgi:periplasmic divalent cation tolerance protein
VTERLFLVLSTFPSEDMAALAGRTLVEEKLAACVNIIPAMRSIYRFQNGVSDHSEALAMIKTTESQYLQLKQRLGELHPYEVPEIVAFPAHDVATFYLSWLLDAVTPIN